MNEKIASLQKEQKNLQMFGTGYLICLIVCMFLGFASPMASAALAAVMVLVYIFVIRSWIKRYRQDVKTAMIEESFRPHFKQIVYSPKDGVPSETITGSGFLPVAHDKTLVIRDSIQGTYQAQQALLTDYSGDFIAGTGEKKNGSRDSYNFLSGCYFDLKLSKDPGLDCVIWPENSVPASVLDRQYPDMTPSCLKASGKSDHEFRVYLPADCETRSIPENFLNAIVRLAEYTPGETAVQVCGGHLRIFIRNRFLYPMKLKVQAPITAQLLTSIPFPEIHYILRVADTLL
ncbi:MAG: hypothetical protein MR528_07340 [Lachnospiraceae bacterium]|nr:hypothetical protein [Lachnospiraceae bacterium]